MTARAGVPSVPPASADVGRARSAAAPAIACAVLILAVKLALATAGFARTLRWAHATARLLARQGLSDAMATLTIQDTAHAVALAAALYPGRALCLEQSLVLVMLLRRAGVDARLQFGVQVHPFLAHTWVEVAGVPVNDFPEHVSHFMVLPEILT
jgi:Transglutaminase-like superfamily